MLNLKKSTVVLRFPLLINEYPCCPNCTEDRDNSSKHVECFYYNLSCVFIKFNLCQQDQPKDDHYFDDCSCIHVLNLSTYVLNLEDSFDHIDGILNDLNDIFLMRLSVTDHLVALGSFCWSFHLFVITPSTLFFFHSTRIFTITSRAYLYYFYQFIFRLILCWLLMFIFERQKHCFIIL